MPETTSMQFEEYELPESWASALVNKETSGMDAEEFEQMQTWLAINTAGYREFECVTCSDEAFFLRQHDASSCGVLACNCSTYTFRMT